LTIYERIRELRISQKMSQTDLAIKMGYKDGSMITKIESGKVDISQKKVIAFAKALGTTPAYLMGWKEDHPDDPLTDQPRTIEARSFAKGMDKLPQQERERILNMFIAAYPGIFEKGTDDHDS